MFCRCVQFYRCQCKKEQEFQNKFEMYKILYQAYADEIRNLWQRSAFLGVFMTLAWGGYGALQLKFIDKILDKSFGLGAYHYYSILLCFVIIILSLLWIAMAKGSKFVQEAHERHIQRYIKKHKCRIFCDLNTYEKLFNKKLCGDLFFCGTLKAYRYSPSRINIALGWLSLLVSGCLAIIHIYSFWDKIKAQIPFLENVLDIITMKTGFLFNNFILVSIILAVLVFILFVSFIIYLTLKGNSQSFLCRFLCVLLKPFIWIFNPIIRVINYLKKVLNFLRNFPQKFNPKKIWRKLFKEKDKTNMPKRNIISRMKDKFQQWRNKTKNSNEKTNSTQGETNKN